MKSEPDIHALAHTIRNAGCRIFRTPTFDDEAGEMRYFAEAVDKETGETWQVYGDDEYGTLVELAEQAGIELMDCGGRYASQNTH